jgi:ribosomal protein L25 (general stress protein Ctc)
MLKLNVEKREIKENLTALRQAGKIPAVFYGPKEPTTPIKLNLLDFKKAWHEAGESTVIALHGEKIWTAFFTTRSTKIRLISVRRARIEEEQIYYESRRTG